VNIKGKSYAPLIVFGTDIHSPNNFIQRGFKKALPKINSLKRQMGKEINRAIKRSRVR